jgi:hypothetical protein
MTLAVPGLFYQCGESAGTYPRLDSPATESRSRARGRLPFVSKATCRPSQSLSFLRLIVKSAHKPAQNRKLSFMYKKVPLRALPRSILNISTRPGARARVSVAVQIHTYRFKIYSYIRDRASRVISNLRRRHPYTAWQCRSCLRLLHCHEKPTRGRAQSV